jgi:hypothetical protein
MNVEGSSSSTCVGEQEAVHFVPNVAPSHVWMMPGPVGFPTVHSDESHTSVFIGHEWDEHVNVSAPPCNGS